MTNFKSFDGIFHSCFYCSHIINADICTFFFANKLNTFSIDKFYTR